MIGSLRGTLVERVLRSEHQAELLVEAGGVGYRVFVPAGAVPSAGEPGGLCFLWVHTHVREDALALYGFASRQERDCFELLLGARGVGPAVALAMLSVLTPAVLRRAVLEGDADALTLVPGIGNKTAARLVLELAPRFEAAPWVGTGGDEAGAEEVFGEPAAGARISGGGASAPASANGAGEGAPHEASGADRAMRREEVKAALTSLGYSADEVRAALARLPLEGQVEDLLRHALQELAGCR
ncbi:MAG: Holliday junction branch migration protein RuvA [Actinobacteria bacterium]|nr:Holliday junction branch migration protein RuvA [Actinomycetota bacterium]